MKNVFHTVKNYFHNTMNRTVLAFVFMVFLAILLLIGVGSITWVRAPSTVYAATTIPQGTTMTVSETWTLANSPYIVDLMYIAENVELTIEPGVVVQFNRYGSIVVRKGGILTALGTASQTIVFTATQVVPQPAYWSQLLFEQGAKARLSHCSIGYATDSLNIASSDVEVRDCTIHSGNGRGIVLNGNGLSPVFENVQVLGHKGVAIEQTTLDMNPSFQNVTLKGNQPDAVGVFRGFPMVGVPIHRDVTMNGAGLNGSPYLVHGWVTVATSNTLVISPGTTIQFGPLGTALQSNIKVEKGSRLLAEGTSTQPITFTTTQVVPQPAYWSYLLFEDGSQARLSFCSMGYGGNWEQAAIVVKSSDVHIHHCLIHHTAGDGIAVESGLTPILEHITVTGTIKGQYSFGSAIRQSPSAAPTYRHIVATNNVINGIAIPYGNVAGDVQWSFGEAGVPAYVQGTLDVNKGSLLTLNPGTELRFMTDTLLIVRGGLMAQGSETQPVTLTGVLQQPGVWRGVAFYEQSYGLLQHSDLSYGGFGRSGLLDILSDNVLVQNSRIHHGADIGIKVLGNILRPTIQYSQIFSNTNGGLCRAPNNGLCFQPNYYTNVLDARNNWWGDATGPLHTTLNPSGLGDRVSDNVLFDPWLGAPATTNKPPLLGKLLFQTGGPRFFSPGATVDYVLTYNNQTSQTIKSTLLTLNLPKAASFIGSTGGGTYWRERHQVFWNIVDLAPGVRGTVTVQVRYAWGIPGGYQDMVVGVATTDTDNPVGIRRDDYLKYQPRSEIASKTTLTEEEFATLRQQSAPLKQFYDRSISEGFLYAAAKRYVQSSARSVVLSFFISSDQKSTRFLMLDGSHVLAMTFTANLVRIEDLTGGMTMDLWAHTRTYWGAWEQSANADSALQGVCAGFGCCFKNCMAGVVVESTLGRISTVVSAISTAADCVKGVLGDKTSLAKCGGAGLSEVVERTGRTIPLLGEMMGTTECLSKCAGNPTSEDCSDTLIECTAAGDVSIVKKTLCVGGCYKLLPEFTYCAYGEQCVPGKGCLDCKQKGVDCTPSQVSVARDPNAKYATEGDLLPGQVVSYTITYENEGAGRAYGVYIVDELDPNLATPMLDISHNGTYISATHTIVWDIGELAPKGQTGSTGVVSFTTRVKEGLPSGTAIVNQAIVYFPSVPEKTPTNPVVRVIQPLSAIPQTIKTTYAQPVAIELMGKAVGSPALMYAMETQPINGTLTGTPPNLTYTPANNFTGQDHFLFTVSNGITTSKAAEITILVEPSSADTEPPQVVWTEPKDRTTLMTVTTSPIFTDTVGPIYAPSIRMQFSESVQDTTVTTETILFRRDGKPVAYSVLYDGTTRQASIVLREPFNTKAKYTVVVSNVQDLAGNPMTSSYTFNFGSSHMKLYLPIIVR